MLKDAITDNISRYLFQETAKKTDGDTSGNRSIALSY